MSLELADLAGLIEPSADDLAMAAEAKRLKSDRGGRPRLRTGRARFRHSHQHPGGRVPAIRAGKTHYTPPAGIPELRQAVAEPLQPPRRSCHPGGQVVVSNGAKHSIHNALMAVCGPGDEVIIPAPYWVSYSDLVKLTGATPVVISTLRIVRVQAHPRPVPCGGHASNEAADDQQPVQSRRASFTSGPSSKPLPTPCSRRVSAFSPMRSTSN